MGHAWVIISLDPSHGFFFPYLQNACSFMRKTNSRMCNRLFHLSRRRKKISCFYMFSSFSMKHFPFFGFSSFVVWLWYVEVTHWCTDWKKGASYSLHILTISKTCKQGLWDDVLWSRCHAFLLGKYWQYLWPWFWMGSSSCDDDSSPLDTSFKFD